MNEQEWKIQISAYADGALSPEEAVQVEHLLAEKPECRVYYNEVKRLSHSLRVLQDEPLSPDGEAKILKCVQQEGRVMKKETFVKVGAGTLLATVLVIVLVAQNVIKTGEMEKLRTVQQGQVTVAVPVAPVAEPAKVSPVAAVAPVSVTTDQKAATPVVLQARVREEVKDAQVRFKGKEAADKVELSRARVQYEPYYANRAVNLADGRVLGYAAPASIMLESEARMGSWGVDFDQYAQSAPGNTEEYSTIMDNPFKVVRDEALSTFSIDVDTASYANVRRYLTNNQMPPKDAARIEEMINYFTYDYPKPEGNEPFSVTTKVAACPWKPYHQLVMIGLKGKTPDATTLPPSNLVFLIDSSGSMQDANKMPLLQQGFKMMVQQLRPEDKVSIVVYAGSAGKVLDPTPGSEKDKIIAAIDALQAGGSTAGGAGIQLAYQLAKDTFIKGGNNRVILATDGDFNVGVSSTSEMERLIEEKRQDGIFLTVLGFGTGNVKDNRMETLADKGNGNYYYIDTIKEARKVLVTELGSTLFTIAKDVKIQVEFNPGQVKAYRLIGYENRMLAKEDFNDDKKDAGEIGAGHAVTALYEIVPASSAETFGTVDNLKYQKPVEVAPSDEVLTVKLRYKEPTEDVSKLISKVVGKAEVKEAPTGDFAWVSAVAEFGMLLRNTEFKGTSSYDDVLKMARANVGEDKFGFRAEFIALVETAQTIAPAGEGQINFK